MPDPLSREHALRVLALSSTAETEDVKRAYRRLAQEHHPDRGGDPDTFHELTVAYDLLVTDETTPSVPRVVRGRPSRPPAPFSDAGTLADLSSIDWSVPVPEVGQRLSRDLLGVALVGKGGAVPKLGATSRAPGSRLNGVAPHLSGSSTAELLIGPDQDDRGRAQVTMQLRAWSRKSRRALDATSLQGQWARIRGSSSTILRSGLPPAADLRATAVIVTDRTEQLLDALGWSLASWTLTRRTDPAA